MKNFGKRLTKLRESKNLTLEDLAKILNLNSTALKLWEQNHITLNIYNIIKMAKYFNVTIDYLLGI